MVTWTFRTSLQDKQQRARRFIIRIWEKTTKQKGETGSYENLTDDQTPSTSKPVFPDPSGRENLELREVQPWDSSISSGVLVESHEGDRASNPAGNPSGCSVSGYAALGLSTNQKVTCSEPQDHSVTASHRTSYFYDSMLSLQKDQTDNGGTEAVKSKKKAGENELEVTKEWYMNKDWKLYYGKKAKKKNKLRKKVVFQVNTGERTIDKECYVELEDVGGEDEESKGQKKRRRKKKRVTSSKAKKRAKRVSVSSINSPSCICGA